jgi:transcriptional regulator with XRE-family HTH domain
MNTTELLEILNRRRHELGMPIAAVCRRSGVHPSTVRRLLAGELSVAGFGIVRAVASALGVMIIVREESVIQMKRKAARAAAAKILRTVQATSALESQAVSLGMLKMIEERIMNQLLAGPGYNGP